MRLFLAVPIPDETRTSLGMVQEQIVDIFGNRGRTRMESMHLTLKFLGETEEERVPAIEAAVGAAVSGLLPFRLVPDLLTFFGQPDRPRIIAIELTPVDRINNLAHGVSLACEKIGFHRDPRPFTPHITIFRPRKPGRVNRRKLSGIPGIPVREVNLYQSRLLPDGARYRKLASFPLKGNETGL